MEPQHGHNVNVMAQSLPYLPNTPLTVPNLGLIGPKLAISPAQETSSAPASSPRTEAFHAGRTFRAARSFRAKTPVSSEIPRSVRPDSGTHPARLPQVSPATPERLYARLPRKGGYPQTKGELSPLSQIFRRHQHLPLGCQPLSPECSTNVLTSLYVLAGLFRTLPASLPPYTHTHTHTYIYIYIYIYIYYENTYTPVYINVMEGNIKSHRQGNVN